MAICHEHNLHVAPPRARPFGIRVRIKAGDPFARLVDPDWQKTHWFASRHERDAALEDMASRHLYSRRGDEPTLEFEKIEQSAVASG